MKHELGTNDAIILIYDIPLPFIWPSITWCWLHGLCSTSYLSNLWSDGCRAQNKARSFRVSIYIIMQIGRRWPCIHTYPPHDEEQRTTTLLKWVLHNGHKRKIGNFDLLYRSKTSTATLTTTTTWQANLLQEDADGTILEYYTLYYCLGLGFMLYRVYVPL